MLSLTFISSEFRILTGGANPKTLPQPPLSPTKCLTTLAASTMGSSCRAVSPKPQMQDLRPRSPVRLHHIRKSTFAEDPKVERRPLPTLPSTPTMISRLWQMVPELPCNHTRRPPPKSLGQKKRSCQPDRQTAPPQVTEEVGSRSWLSSREAEMGKPRSHRPSHMTHRRPPISHGPRGPPG